MYWMWTKRKNSLSSHVVASSTNLSSYGDSWEERAFAEDAAGPLGGCIWPPRSYTCSFCKREFKSAQALGGHMNVHRRERARLKQLSPCPNNQILSPTSTSSGIQYPSLIHPLVYNQNFNHGFLATPSSPYSRVSLPTSQVIDYHEKSALSSSPPFSSPIVFQEEQRRTTVISPPLKSNLVADSDRYCYNISDVEKEEKNFNFLDSSKYRTKRDCVEADLSFSLNVVACRNDHESITTSSDEDENMSCKRRRTDDDATVSFFPKQSLIHRNIVHDPQTKVLEVSPTSKEDLDLELRLGDHRSA